VETVPQPSSNRQEPRAIADPSATWRGRSDNQRTRILAVVPAVRKASQPDISWIKKNVPVLEVANALGMLIRHHRAQCWRAENHSHGDADPSLHFYERGNRVRCFVCDQRGGHSNVDLVMGVLGIGVGEALSDLQFQT
jgi:hypothetical protein